MKTFASSRKRLVLISGFLLAFLVVLNFATYVLYKRAKDYLDNELGERLRSIALTMSRAVEVAGPSNLRADEIDSALYTMLHMVKAENLLSNIVILTPEGRTVVDLGNYSREGELNPFIDLDYGAVSLARSGLSAYTSLYRSGDLYMKSAYAPITTDENDVMGILGVEAGATYFDVLRALGNAIILVDVASLFVMVVLGVFFYRQTVSLDRAQAAVIRGENLATMGRMVAGIAHEIRNPLSIIKTSAERLEKKHGAKDELLTYISEEVDYLDRILSGYLNFAKAGTHEPRPQVLQKVLRRSLLILDRDIQEKSIKVTQDVPETDVIVIGDDKRIQQAILNVLINAIQAVGPGGKIELVIESQPREATLTIRDDGTGIKKKNLGEITKPFYTTKEQGSGLGLSIVSKIIEQHNGDLDIRSTPGAGTEVSMSFPCPVTQ